MAPGELFSYRQSHAKALAGNAAEEGGVFDVEPGYTLPTLNYSEMSSLSPPAPVRSFLADVTGPAVDVAPMVTNWAEPATVTHDWPRRIDYPELATFKKP